MQTLAIVRTTEPGQHIAIYPTSLPDILPCKKKKRIDQQGIQTVRAKERYLSLTRSQAVGGRRYLNSSVLSSSQPHEKRAPTTMEADLGRSGFCRVAAYVPPPSPPHEGTRRDAPARPAGERFGKFPRRALGVLPTGMGAVSTVKASGAGAWGVLLPPPSPSPKRNKPKMRAHLQPMGLAVVRHTVGWPSSIHRIVTGVAAWYGGKAMRCPRNSTLCATENGTTARATTESVGGGGGGGETSRKHSEREK